MFLLLIMDQVGLASLSSGVKLLFYDTFYKFIQGTNMGNCMAPSLANLFLWLNLKSKPFKTLLINHTYIPICFVPGTL